MSSHEVLGDGQAKTRTVTTPGPGAVDLVEALKDARQLDGGDPGTVVGNPDLDLRIARARPHLDHRPVAESVGVLDQVLQYLRHSHAVRGDKHLGGHPVAEFPWTLAIRDPPPGLRDDVMEDESRKVELDLAFQQRKLGDASEQTGEVLRLLGDAFDEAALLWRRQVGAEGLGGKAQRRQRRSHFVCQVGDEICAHGLQAAQFRDVVKKEHGPLLTNVHGAHAQQALEMRRVEFPGALVSANRQTREVLRDGAAGDRDQAGGQRRTTKKALRGG